MNTSPDDFEKLRKLMSLKRHEQPPPGYFNQLPGRIIARIEAGESAPTFWQRLSDVFVMKPSHAYALGLFVCGALGVGTFLSFKSQTNQAGSPAVAVQPVQKTVVQPALAAQPAPSSTVPVTFVNSTNPAIGSPKVPSLFDRSTQQPVVPVSFQR